MMERFLIDTHAHLCATEFDHDRQEVINGPLAAGIDAILIAGETLEDDRHNDHGHTPLGGVAFKG